MKVETKTYPSGKQVIVLTPGRGFKYVTNGFICSSLVYLGKNDDIDNWSSTNKDIITEIEEEHGE